MIWSGVFSRSCGAHDLTAKPGLILLLTLAAACGGSSGRSAPPAPPGGSGGDDPPANIAGEWLGFWSESLALHFTASIEQDGDELTGEISHPLGGLGSIVSSRMTHSDFRFVIFEDERQTVVEGHVDGDDGIVGTFEVTLGRNRGRTGSFKAQRIGTLAIEGRYWWPPLDSWEIITIAGEESLGQIDAVSFASFFCHDGWVTGDLSESVIDLVIAQPSSEQNPGGGQIRLRGDVSESGLITGGFVVEGGICDGHEGAWEAVIR